MTAIVIGKRRIPPDLISVIVLIALCWLFFWRLLTPNPINQESLVEGDFSGQFVAFAQYQAVRLQQGAIPLWNPYNYGGHPFLADTQSVVFYPPRLLTIALLNGRATPQRMYDALQKEMILHTLLASLLMYAFVRRLTGNPNGNQFGNQFGSPFAALIAGIVFAYSGYLTGYPQLQLAVMEAGIWLPLALLGIHEATQTAWLGWRWIGLAGLALGLSLTAGHPQTTLFFVYTALAYLAYCTINLRRSWTIFVVGAGLFGLIGAGLAAVQLLPGWEYTQLTVRTALSVDALGNGFPIYDLLQMIFPGVLSQWSPLYIGVVALALAVYAVWRRTDGALFWLGLAIVGVILSFGHSTILYDLVYNVVPGFSLFREQERSAFIIAAAASILAGLGTAALQRSSERPGEVTPRGFRVALWGTVAFMAIITLGLFFNRLITPSSDGKSLSLVAFSLLVAVITALFLSGTFGTTWPPAVSVGLVGLVVFELFSFGRNNPNVEVRPAERHLFPGTLVSAMLADKEGVFRIDGTRLPGQNYGTLYGLMDVEGISPLRLTSVDHLLKLPSARLWEAFAVRYIPTANDELPVPSTIVGQQEGGPQEIIKLHKLNNPRPFARLVYTQWIEPDDTKALNVLADSNYDARHSVILPADPKANLPASAPDGGRAQVTSFKPESITIDTTSPTHAILSVSLVYYPGWQATIDGQSAPLLRADTALTALVVPQGDHTVELDYRPTTFSIGALISIWTLILLAIGELSGFAITFRRTNPGPPSSSVTPTPDLSARYPTDSDVTRF